MKIKLLKNRNEDKNFWNKQIFRVDMFPRAEFLPDLWVVLYNVLYNNGFGFLV